MKKRLVAALAALVATGGLTLMITNTTEFNFTVQTTSCTVQGSHNTCS